MDPSPLIAWSLEPTWAVPFLGAAVAAVVAAVAWLVGRRLFVPHAADAQGGSDEPPEVTFLRGFTLERRATPRRRGNEVEIQLCDEAGGTPFPAWVTDRSIGGLCVLVERPLDEGARMKLRPKNPPEALPWVPVLIRNIRNEEGLWEVGCQFVGTPPYNILLSFG